MGGSVLNTHDDNDAGSSALGSLGQFLPRMEEVLPEWREERGSLGSRVVTLEGGARPVQMAAISLLQQGFARYWHRVGSDTATFLAPSVAHRAAVRRVTDLLDVIGALWSTPVAACRASPQFATLAGRVMLQSDATYLVGADATGFDGVHDPGDERRVLQCEMIGSHRHLMVEVEGTTADDAQLEIYRRGGAQELWQLELEVPHGAVSIWDLGAGSPRLRDTSQLFKGLHAGVLHAGLGVLASLGGSSAWHHPTTPEEVEIHVRMGQILGAPGRPVSRAGDPTAA